MPTAGAKEAIATPGTSCSTLELTKLKQAKQFLIKHQHVLADDFEIDAKRSGQERRAWRQILRRIEKLKFKCKDAGCTNSTAVHTVVGGNVARMCVDQSRPFCLLVDLTAHEFGHLAHIPRKRAGEHNRDGWEDPDNVYQFGFFAADLCAHELDTSALVSESAHPAGVHRPLVNSGIILYPRKNYQGRPRQFLPAGAGERSVRNMPFWNDLRFIGRDDAFSSAKVHSGIWELCDGRNHTGPCVYLSADTPSFKPLDINDQVSSIRHFASWPSTGILVYRDENLSGPGKYFEESGLVDLGIHGLAGKVSSVRSLSGTWEGCEKPNLQGWCHLLSGSVPKLSSKDADNRLRSLKRLNERRFDGLVLYRDTLSRGGYRYLPAGSYTNLKALGVHDAASSLATLGGSWRVCSKKHFKGRCEIVSGVVRDLKSLKLNDKITSAQKL